MSVWQRLKYRKETQKLSSPEATSGSSFADNRRLTANLEETLAYMRQTFGDTDDFKIRRFDVFGRFPAALLYLEHLTNQREMKEDILRPLLQKNGTQDENGIVDKDELLTMITNDILIGGNVSTQHEIRSLVEQVLSGQVVIIIDGFDRAIISGSSKVEHRAISQPETEQVIRGSREGFIESLGVNLALLRNRLPSVDLLVKTVQIGRRTKTKVAVCYLRDVCNPALAKEVIDRLQRIDIDGVIDSGYLEQFIEDHHFSPFPQIQNTERPDKCVANLLEGRVIILVDGCPFALIAPAVFSQFYQSVDDYSERFVLSSFVRLSRLVALLFSLIFSIFICFCYFFQSRVDPDRVRRCCCRWSRRGPFSVPRRSADHGNLHGSFAGSDDQAASAGRRRTVDRRSACDRTSCRISRVCQPDYRRCYRSYYHRVVCHASI